MLFDVEEDWWNKKPWHSANTPLDEVYFVVDEKEISNESVTRYEIFFQESEFHYLPTTLYLIDHIVIPLFNLNIAVKLGVAAAKKMKLAQTVWGVRVGRWM